MDKGLSETRTIPQTLRYECLWWPYKTHKRKNAIYGKKPYMAFLGLPYSFFRVALMGFLGLLLWIFRVALWKSTDIYRISFRIKLGFIRVT